MQSPFLTIILPTYNRKNTIIDILLPSLEIQNYKDRELLVIDDCSSDDTERYFSSDSFISQFPDTASRTRYFRNKENLGSPASRNVGFCNSLGKWVYMVEDDLQITNSNFFSLFFAYQSLLTSIDPTIGVICPKRKEYSTGYYKNYTRQLVEIGTLSGELYFDPEQSYSGYVPNAQACSFIKTYITAIIHYDTVSYNYFREESDFYERVKNAGYRIYYLGDILVSHHRMDLVHSGGNRKHSVSITNEYKYRKSHYIFLKKYNSYATVKIVIYVFVRLWKHIGTLLHTSFFKNLLSYFRI